MSLGDTSGAERTVPLQPGDALLLYTDGVTEARDARREFYPLEERVAEVAAKMPAAGTATCWTGCVTTWCGMWAPRSMTMRRCSWPGSPARGTAGPRRHSLRPPRRPEPASGDDRQDQQAGPGVT